MTRVSASRQVRRWGDPLIRHSAVCPTAKSFGMQIRNKVVSFRALRLLERARAGRASPGARGQGSARLDLLEQLDGTLDQTPRESDIVEHGGVMGRPEHALPERPHFLEVELLAVVQDLVQLA